MAETSVCETDEDKRTLLCTVHRLTSGATDRADSGQVQPLLAALDDVGLAPEWVLPRDQETVQPGAVVLRAHRGTRTGTRTLELPWAEVQQRLLLELADLAMWAQGVAQLMNRNDSGRHPWRSFTAEWKVWA